LSKDCKSDGLISIKDLQRISQLSCEVVFNQLLLGKSSINGINHSYQNFPEQELIFTCNVENGLAITCPAKVENPL
jgi:hypothetical protein